MILLISYDLKSPDKDYASLYEAIKNSAKSWWHYLESVWIVRTDLDPNSYYERVKPYFDEDDSFFIVDITEQKRQGWLPSKAWDWLKSNRD